jgi:hypothetical protein
LSSFTLSQGFIIDGPNIYNSFEQNGLGWVISSAGDVNKDGYQDIIIGEPWYNNSSDRAFVIYGGSNHKDINVDSLTIDQGFSIIGESNTNQWRTGYALSSAGDINNDGFGDIMIGAPNAHMVGINYVIHGGSNIADIDLSTFTSDQGFTISGAHQFDEIGWSSSSTDVNGDGYDDIILGSPGSTYDGSIGGQYSSGITYVIYGNEL